MDRTTEFIERYLERDEVLINCKIGKCGATMSPEKTFLPSLEVMGQKEGRRVKIEDLPRHAICERHSRAGRAEGYKIFGYRGTVALIERREQEKAEVGKFFAIHGAMQEAGITPPRKKHRPAKTPSPPA